jgi:hypothetical protein
MDVQCNRDLLELHFSVETEAEDLALARGQVLLMDRERGDCLLLHRSRLRSGAAVGHPLEEAGFIVIIAVLVHHRLASPSAQLVEAGIDGDSGEPGGKGGAAIKITDPGERLDQAVLGSSVRLRRADILPAHHPHPPLVTVDELAERLMVAVLSPQHQRVVRLGKIGSRRVHGLCSQHTPSTISAVSG